MDRPKVKRRAPWRRTSVTVLTLCAAHLVAAGAFAGSVAVHVKDMGAKPVADVVVLLKPLGDARPARTAAKADATMDQRDLTFVPEVLVVQVGTSVNFPNNDNVKHNVYSFSPAKSFQLPLYVGHVHPPLVFDKPGVVTLGCNIHDSMLGFIYVTDAPWFGKTAAQGTFAFADVPAGSYDLTVWHPRLNEPRDSLTVRVEVPASGEAVREFMLTKSPTPAPNNNSARKWRGY